MKIVLIGGSGLLGYESILHLSNHDVLAFSLPNIPKDLNIPSNTTMIFKDYTTLSDEELLHYLKDAYGLIFAAGIDERIQSNSPIYELYERINITPLKRLLTLAKQAHLKSVVICGSYFSYFDRLWPHLNLYQTHPYIRSRVDQANMALSFADDNFSVSIIELPYIFGIQNGREPVWTILVDILLKQKERTLYSKGGTTMITKKQASQAIIGALFNAKTNHYPIGYYNMDNASFLKIVHQGLGINRPIYLVPNCLFKLYTRRLSNINKRKNIHTGLDLTKFHKLQTKHLFIDKEIAHTLGVKDDDIKSMIIDSIKLSKEILETKKKVTKMTY